VFDADPAAPEETTGFDDDGKRQALDDAWEIIQTWTDSRRTVLTSLLEASRRAEREVKGAELAAGMGLDWPRDRVDRELNRARKAMRRDMGVLAVARAAAGCATISPLVAAPGPRLRFADLPPAVRTALARHAEPATPAGRTVCGCRVIFADARRPGLYVLGPGLLLLAAYTEPDKEERRRALIDLAFQARPETASTTAVVAAVPAARAGLVQGAVHRVQLAAANVARLPAAPQLAQNPALVRATAAAVAVVVLGVGALVASQPSSPPRPQPPIAAGSPTPSVLSSPSPLVTPSAAAPVPVPTASASAGPAVPTRSAAPTAPPPEAPAPGPDAPGGPGPAEPAPEPPADGGHQGSTVPPATVRVTVDAALLANPTFTVSGLSGRFDARQPQTLDLAPGRHRFTAAGSGFTFTVTPAGTVDYGDEQRTYLDGAGTSTLSVKGLDVTVDARPLTNPLFSLLSETVNLSTTELHTFRLIPGNHVFVNRQSASFVFAVEADGTVSFGDGQRTYLEGAGTSTLIVKGLDVTVDARPLTNPLFSLLSETVNLSTSELHTFRLVPGNHIFINRQSASFVFSVKADGTVGFGADQRTYLDGAGTSTLVVKGVDVTVDARQLTNPLFSLLSETVNLSTSELHTFRLIPGNHIFINRQSASFVFAVKADGTVSFGADQRTYLDGAGTSTLVVKGVDITVDARHLTTPTFQLVSETANVSTAQAHTFRLVPGNHIFLTTGLTFTFTVTPAGTVAFDARLAYLSGAGTATLVVDPPGTPPGLVIPVVLLLVVGVLRGRGVHVPGHAELVERFQRGRVTGHQA
jgi:hypothetical protein